MPIESPSTLNQKFIPDTAQAAEHSAEADPETTDPKPAAAAVAERRSLPFTLLFQSFLVLSLAMMVTIVLVLFKAVSVVAVENVRSNYLEVARDEIVYDGKDVMQEVYDLAAFAPTLSILSTLTGAFHLREHAQALFLMFPTFNVSAAYVFQSATAAVICVSPLDSNCALGKVDATAGITWSDADSNITSVLDYSAIARWCMSTTRAIPLWRATVISNGVRVDGCSNVSSQWLATAVVLQAESLQRAVTSRGGSGVFVTFRRAEGPTGATITFPAPSPWVNTPLSDGEIEARIPVPVPSGPVLVFGVALSPDAATGFSVGLSVMVAVSIVFLIATAVAIALTLRIVLAPLSYLHEDMAEAVALRMDKLPERRSVIRELDDMAVTFSRMIARLRSYKPVIAEFRQMLRDRSMSARSLASSTDSLSANYHLLTVHLTYVSKRLGQVKRVVSFEHTYRDGDPHLLDSLMDTCKAHVEAHRFELVTITVDERSQQVTIASNRQLEEMIASSPGSISITMRKCSKKTILSPVAVAVDLVGIAGDVVLVFLLIFSPGFTAEDNLALGVWAGFFAFSMMVNIGLCLWLLRDGRRNERFKQWLSQAGTEVSILLLLASQTTQHVHFLWSGWSLGPLHFNAPRVMTVWTKAVKYSLFGFVFGDLGKVAFKIFRLSRGTGGAGFLAFCSCSLLLSLASIGLQLPKKIALLAVGSKRTDRAKSQVEEHTEFDAVAAARRRPRWGYIRTLTIRRVSVVMFRLPRTLDRRSSAKFAVECSFIYSTVFKHVKSFKGTMLYFHGTEIAAVFNSPTQLDDHFAAAVQCAEASCNEIIREFKGIQLTAVITCESSPVGTLGTDTRKSHQCFAPWQLLRKLSSCAEELGIPIVCTARSRSAAPSTRAVVFGEVKGVENILRVCMQGSASDLAAQRQIHLDDAEYQRRLRSLLAPFGLHRMADTLSVAQDLHAYLTRFLQGTHGEDSGCDAHDGGSDLDSVSEAAPAPAPSKGRNAAAIVALDFDL